MAMFVEFLEGSGRSVSSLRRVLLSGDWVPTDLPGRVVAVAPGAAVTSMGGATEAAIWSIVYDIEAVDPGWDSVPYGRPMVNQSFHVLNDRWQECPVWVVGELFIGGIGLAEGYWGDAEKTAASFVRHPVSGERLYRTGDLGRWLPSGDIEFCGRDDFQVKVGGFRIELGEVEQALAGCPGVRVAIAAAVGDRHHRRLVGYVVPAEGAAADDDLVTAVREHATAVLPGYMVPSSFMVLDGLPLTANGKVDRSHLPEPGQQAPTARTGGELTPLAVQLARITAHAMGVDEVDPWANFFELGGDSIIGVRIITQVNDQGIDVRLQDLFEAQSIADLADRLLARGAVQPARGAEAATPVTAFQRRLFAVAAPGLPAGVHRVDLTVAPELSLDAAQEAVTQIVGRHPALRTRFLATGDDGWCQTALPAAEVTSYLPRIELGMLPAEVRAEAVAGMVAEMRTELDLERGVVFGAALFDLGAGGRILTLLGHELVVDAGSWEIVVAEFLNITQQLLNGDSVVLPPPTDPFLRWAEQSPEAAGAAVEATEPAAVPAGTPRHATGGLSAGEVGALTDAVWHGYRLTLGEAVLAALVRAVRQVGVDGPLLVVGDRRDDDGIDTSRTVGAFLSAAAVPAEVLDPAGDLAALLPAVKRWTRGGPAAPAPGTARVALHMLERYGERSRLARLLPEGNPAPWPTWDQDSLGAAVRLTVVDYAGALHLRWTGTDPSADLPALAGAFTAALLDIAAHSRARESGHLAAGDFPLADLGADDLAAVLDDLEEEL